MQAAPVEGLPGQPAEVVLRCLPPDFAFAVLDAPSLSLCADVLALARPDREVRIEANGPELRILHYAGRDAVPRDVAAAPEVRFALLRYADWARDAGPLLVTVADVLRGEAVRFAGQAKRGQ